MSRRDDVWLLHMLDAAREAVSFASDKSRTDLDTDRLLVLALTKSIEIIGEAASHLPSATRDSHPEFAWGDIIGMRNRLIHAYYEVNIDTLWPTLTEDLPTLIQELENIL